MIQSPVGWQSLSLLAITLLVGLRGSNAFESKVRAILIGLLRTFLVNLGRMAAIVTIIWLFVFWYFAYAFVLEGKQVVGNR